ncbi:MAG: redox-regulated ATPase YchF [Candidatus Paceibacterota bacterium]
MSKLSIGIVGLPNVGKSTLFNILTKQSVTSANYPFATIDPNVGIVSVPDERLDKLTELSQSKQKIPAVVEFYDIAGLVKGANKGEGLGNEFLGHIKETHAILHMVRVFEGRDIIHVDGETNPSRDIDTIEEELILKDLDTIEKHMDNVEGKTRTGDKEAKKELEILEKIKDTLMSSKPLSSTDLINNEDVKKVAKHLQLLTIKKQLFLLNGEESDVSDELKQKIKDLNYDYIVADLAEGEAIPDIVKKAYEILDLITFLTTGEKESRAWTTKKGSTAPQAAGVIHSDFEKNFIRAEVVSYEALVEAGSWTKARSNGKLRVEGKEYIIKDGDVVHFRVGK